MPYPKYIKDLSDGMLMKLSKDKTEWENDYCGTTLDIESYKLWKSNYSTSTKKEYDEYQEILINGIVQEVGFEIREWKTIINVLSKNVKTKSFADIIKVEVDKKIKWCLK